MEDPSLRPPPLPPKARKSPPASNATVLTNCIIQDDYGHNHRFSNTLGVQPAKSNTHVVKIQINPSQDTYANGTTGTTSVTCVVSPCIKISVNTSDGEMVHNKTMVDSSTDTNGYFFYDQFHGEVMSSGQISPSDTLDSGTCSDLDGTPPPLSSKKNSGISVTIIGEQTKRLSSLNSSGTEVDSDDNESNTSFESYSNKKLPLIIDTSHLLSTKLDSSSFLPQTLLQDIRNAKISVEPPVPPKQVLIQEKSYEERKEEEKQKCDNFTGSKRQYESDKYYDFHLNENVPSDAVVSAKNVEEDETFAGYKDLLGDGAATIRSAKGTVRGVKNRVRAGIATFLQINSTAKNYKEKEAGKVVVYTTTMGIIRDTYQACMKVKQILRTLLIKFEERDVFMSGECQQEIRERMRCDYILVPQVFVDGQHVGDAETIEKLNESGELRRILKPFKSMDACHPCKVCGGYRLLPCTVCNGSKKSVHRNHFTAEFVALKCMNCDEVGLVRCTAC